jgi:hypothetical protein
VLPSIHVRVHAVHTTIIGASPPAPIPRAGSTCQGSTTHIDGEGWCVGAVKLELRLRGQKQEGKEHWPLGA